MHRLILHPPEFYALLNIYEPIDWTFQKVVNTAFATVLVVAMPMVVASLVYKS